MDVRLKLRAVDVIEEIEGDGLDFMDEYGKFLLDEDGNLRENVIVTIEEIK